MRSLHALMLILLVALLAACGGDDDTSENPQEDGDSGAVAAIEAYWEARIALDEEAVFQYSCAAREAGVPGEIQSLSSVTNLRLEGMSCRQVGQDGDDLLVSCDGSIVGDYGTGDDTEFPLRTYRMTQEDGEWKMCGEAAAPAEATAEES